MKVVQEWNETMRAEPEFLSPHCNKLAVEVGLVRRMKVKVE